jgi:HlyD family secretion protein/epimerase transport system membrane fusion protein
VSHPPVSDHAADDAQHPDEERWTSATPKRLIATPILLGYLFVLLFFGGLGTWAALAHIASAVVASGVVSPEGSRKTIQHLEGGIIAEILVDDGDEVLQGDPLVVLQEIQARAAFQVLEDRRGLLAAKRSRLLAEQGRKQAVRFPDWLLKAARDDPELQETLGAQQDLFETRRKVHKGRKAIGQKRIDALGEEITGRQSLLVSQRRQLTLLDEEIAAKKPLADKGLIPRPDYLQVARLKAQIEGTVAENKAAMAQARQSIGETELQIVNEDSRMMDEIVNELAETRSELASVEERLYAQRDILERTVVVAPVSGVIVKKRFHTTGGVVGPGEPILDIVPHGAELLIDARVLPVDIDEVTTGQEARINFLSLVQRRLPQITGVVRWVSADSLMDEVTGEGYYLARVEVLPEQLAKLGPGIKITAGMPAEVLIVTGERTFLEYLAQPILESLRRSFRES